jgi:hypothetical protein
MAAEKSYRTDSGRFGLGPGYLFAGAALEALIPNTIDFAVMTWLPDQQHASCIGKTDGIVFTSGVSITEHVSAQGGTVAHEFTTTGQTATVATAALQLSPEKLSELLPQYRGNYDDSGVFRGLVLAENLFTNSKEYEGPLLYRKIRNGVCSTEPADNILYFKTAIDPTNDEFTADAETQYSTAITWRARPNDEPLIVKNKLGVESSIYAFASTFMMPETTSA